jgi:hypothetical protein
LMKSIFSKAMWVGRATVFCVGLVVKSRRLRAVSWSAPTSRFAGTIGRGNWEDLKEKRSMKTNSFKILSLAGGFAPARTFPPTLHTVAVNRLVDRT